MLSTSLQFSSIATCNPNMLLKAKLTFADDTELDLDGDDFMMGTFSVSDAVSSSSSFDIGATIMNSASFELNNIDGRFDEYDFTGAVIEPQLGLELPDGTTEWIRKGVYGIEQPDSYGGTIGIEALDNMRLLEREWPASTTTFPATLQRIVSDICTLCGVTLVNPSFSNGSLTIQSAPDDSSMTCLKMLSYAMEASCHWARCDEWGRIKVGWYDTSAFETTGWLDGGTYDDASPYASGDVADGGSFLDYTSGTTVDAGTSLARRYAQITAYSDATVMTDDVVVTGVRVTGQDAEVGGETVSGQTVLNGTEGYVLEISGNPLVVAGQESTVAQAVAANVVGMRFRPLSVTAIGDPCVEAGDPAMFTDGQMRTYRTYLTSVEYALGNREVYSCNAQTPGRRKADVYSDATRAIVENRNALKREKTAREAAVAGLASQLAGSSGLYMTEEEQLDGSTIYYMHDKPTLAESQIVWKMTAEAFGISTDGGETYPYGLDATGTAILNRIYAIGLDADYITTGSIQAASGNGSAWNLDSGVFKNNVSHIMSFVSDGYAKVPGPDSYDYSVMNWENVDPSDIDRDIVVLQDDPPDKTVEILLGSHIVGYVPDVVVLNDLIGMYIPMTIRFHAASAMSDVGAVLLGMEEYPSSMAGTLIVPEFVLVSGGKSPSGWSVSVYTPYNVDHYSPMLIEPASPFDAAAGDLLFEATYYMYYANVAYGRPMGLWGYYGIYHSDDTPIERYGQADFAFEVSNEYEYPYVVHYYNMINGYVEMSASRLLGISESHVPFAYVAARPELQEYLGIDDEFDWRGGEVEDRYVGGLEGKDGFLAFNMPLLSGDYSKFKGVTLENTASEQSGEVKDGGFELANGFTIRSVSDHGVEGRWVKDGLPNDTLGFCLDCEPDTGLYNLRLALRPFDDTGLEEGMTISVDSRRLNIMCESTGAQLMCDPVAGYARVALSKDHYIYFDSVGIGEYHNGTFTRSISSGNASTATKLKTARSLRVALGTTYDSTDPAMFDGSAALDIPVSGTLPIARGGTDSTGVSSTSTVSDIATAGTNVTLESASFYSWGKLAMLTVTFKPTAAITSGSTVFTLKSGKRPALVCNGVDSNTQYPCTLNSGGTVVCRRALTSGTSYSFRATYLLA